MTDFAENDPPYDPAPAHVGSLNLPPDALVIPFSVAGPAGYETGFGAFCHGLIHGPYQNAVVHCRKRADQGLTFILLRYPLLAWNLDSNRTAHCKALILVERNTSKRKDVWTCDDVVLARKIFETSNVMGS